MSRILVADDNPISLRYFAETLQALGYDCDGAEDGAQALRLANASRYSVLLLDLDMPHFSGQQVHSRLRANALAASYGARHVATSAEMDSPRRTALLAQGFDAVLAKPAAHDEVASLLRVLLASPGRVAEPRAGGIRTAAPPVVAAQGLLDDVAARKACGDMSIVASLRQLFAQELHALPAEIDDLVARGDAAGLLDRLHRLRASCGLCGAPRLDAATQASRRAAGTPAEATALAELRAVAAQTLSALQS